MTSPRTAKTLRHVLPVDPRKLLMHRILSRLERHRRLTLVLAVVYFVVITLGHDVAQELAFWAQDKLNRDRWNALNRYVGILGVVALAAWCLSALRRGPRPLLALTVGGITTACSIACFNTLFVMNVEIIHFPQYALLAWLIYPLTRRYGETVVLVTLLGAIDEGYQYLVLHRHWNIYFDLNDVTLNLLGGGFGVVLVYLTVGASAELGRKDTYTLRRCVTSPTMIVLMTVVLLGVVGGSFGLATVLPSDGSWLVLRRCGPAGAFWIETEWGKRYHVLQPIEAMMLWVPLLVMYFTLDFAGPSKPGSRQSVVDGLPDAPTSVAEAPSSRSTSKMRT